MRNGCLCLEKIMKINILRNGDSVAILDVDDSTTIDELMEKCQPFASNSLWCLSLNNCDAINVDRSKSLADVGVVSGDRLHIITLKPSNNDELKSQLLQMGFLEENVNKVVSSLGAESVEDAIELLKMFDDNVVSGEPEKRADSAVHTDLLKPVTISSTSSLYTELNMILNKFGGLSSADHLLLAITVIYDKSGFRLQCGFDKLLSGWEIGKQMGFYRVTFIHELVKEMTCFLSLNIAGAYFLLSGILNAEDSDVYQTKLKLSDYVNSCTDLDARKVYRNLGKLSRKVKDSIGSQLDRDVRRMYDIEDEAATLSSLPLDIKHLLACRLEPVSLCRLSRVNKEWMSVCNDDHVWKNVLKSLTGRTVSSSGLSFKETVKKEIVDHRNRKRQLQRLPTDLPYSWRIDRPDLIAPPQYHVPGMIGGSYDLHPAIGPHSETFQRPDLLPGNMRLPRPRFDPYGPLSADYDEYVPRRGRHPDMLQRPSFNNPFDGDFI